MNLGDELMRFPLNISSNNTSILHEKFEFKFDKGIYIINPLKL